MLFAEATFRQLCLAREMRAEDTAGSLVIARIAREVGISPYHFIRQFEALFGQTPHQFRIGRRMEQARRLLASGNYSVTETCFEVGMSSVGSFSSLFLQRTGESPSRFQRRARTLVQVPETMPSPLYPGCFSLLACLPPDAFRNFREAKSALRSVTSE